METASKNEFSSFEYIKPADYLPGFDRAANPGAWDNARAQERDNAAMREKESKQWQKTIDQAQNFSVTLANEYKKQRDRGDIERQNQARELEQELLAKGYDFSFKKMAEYYANEDAHNTDTGYYDSLAAQVQETDPELAEKLRNLTGRKAKMMNQVLVMSAANNYENDLYSTIGDISIDRGGSTLTWDNATTTPERRMLIAEWRIKHGLKINNIGGYNAEFLRDNYYSTIQKVDARVLREASLERRKAVKEDALAQETDVFRQAALRNDGSLGRATIAFVKSNKGTYGSEAGARRKAREILLGLVETGQISVENFKSIYLHKFPHSGMGGKEVDISAWKEFDIENDSELDGLLQAAEAKGVQRYEQGRALKANRFVMEIDKQIEEQGRPVTEAEARQAVAIFKQQFPGYQVPARLRTLHTRTLEDTEDSEIVADMQDKLDRGIPLTDEYTKIKGDPELYAKWQKISQSDLGNGLDPTYAAKGRKMIEAEIKETLDMTMGVSETDTPEYLTMKGNAERLYASAYREAQFHTPQEKHTYAMQQVREALSKNGGAALKVRPSISSAQSYALKRDTALSAITRDGASAVRKGILPGTESDFKLLEAYAKDPSTGSIPPIYNVLAKDLNKPGYTGFDLANEQYRAVTGKDLPRVPTHVERLRKSSPFVQRLMTFKGGSRANVQQASIIEKGNGNFNIQEAIIPGLQLEAVG